MAEAFRRRPHGPAGTAPALALVALLGVCSATALSGFAAGAQSPSQGAAGAITVERLVYQAGVYMTGFDLQFANVIAEERYFQEARTSSGPITGMTSSRGGSLSSASGLVAPVSSRELRSDFLLVKLKDSSQWLPFRDVFEVDGKPVRDREDRLLKLLQHPADSTLDQALNIMEESARYNIGNIQRTMNLPIFALAALRPDEQPRFRFSGGKPDASIGTQVFVVEYREETGPPLIHGAANRPLFAHGRFWIEMPEGRILKSELLVDDVTVRASVVTTYLADRSFALAVPVEMREEYRLPTGGVVKGTATYGHFRRFGVTVTDEVSAPPRTITDVTTGMTLIEIPAGQFAMGSVVSEAGRRDDERIHDVSISRPFFLGRFEVTVKEWQTVMGTAPSQPAGCGDCPIERVSVADVETFLTTLNARTKGVRYRLPTEAEWEIACRAGSSTPFSSGVNLTTAEANYNGRRPYPTFRAGEFRERTVPAGSFATNLWGLGDMHGNVQEWTADWYGPYPTGVVTDPAGPAAGAKRVVRGGSWQSDGAGLRCAARDAHAVTERATTIGFRVAADLTEPQ